MALGESYAWGSIDDYFSAVASFEDYNFNDPSHHGTPEERLTAAQLGFGLQDLPLLARVGGERMRRPLTWARGPRTFVSAIVV